MRALGFATIVALRSNMRRRAYALPALCLGLLLSGAVGRAADEAPPGHFRFSGPMSDFLAEGKKAAPVAAGLPFTITLSDGGATIAPARLELKGAGWASAAQLAFENLKYGGGHLTGQVKL